MNGQQVGYIRVSSVSQNTDRQLSGIVLDKIFEEKVSGKNTKDRPELKRCFEHLREGDVLHVHSIDRLARNLIDLKMLVEQLTSKGVVVKFHKENLTFDNNSSKPIDTLLFNILASFAEFERTLIKERQREGIESAKASGKKWGGQFKLTVEQIQQLKIAVASGFNKSNLAKEYGISRATLYNLLNEK